MVCNRAWTLETTREGRMKLVLGWIVALSVLATMFTALATAGEGKGRSALPPGAVKVGEDTYYLGTKTVDGVRLEGYAFVHRRGEAKTDRKPGGGGTTCYTLLAAGAKWRVSEPFLVNASKAPSSVGSAMTDLMSTDVGTWESAAAADIFGVGSSSSAYNVNLNAVDGSNGAEFGPIADAGVIAVTYTWGQFGGPPQSRGLVEWDMLFDNQDFDWSTTGAPDAMDFRNISTHELGHAMGLGHPSGTCTEESMYAYASPGETKKQSLNAGDSAGINVMY
jgi:hypothetical protein